MHFRNAVAVLISLAALPALATVKGYAPRDLHQQWERAKHVALVRITAVRRLGEVEKNRPLGPCGVLYGIEVQEQFKGELPRQTAFATHRVLFPERPLRRNEDVLVFLRDLRNPQAADRAIQDELDSAADAIATCGPMETTLYVAMSEENVFALVPAPSTGDKRRWLEYRYTSMPADIGPKVDGKCDPLPGGGCLVTDNPRVAWLPIRGLLKSWSSK